MGVPVFRGHARYVQLELENTVSVPRRSFMVLNLSLTYNYCMSVPLSHDYSTLPKHNLHKPTLSSLRSIRPPFSLRERIRTNHNLLPTVRAGTYSKELCHPPPIHPLDSGSQDINAPLQTRLSMARVPPSLKTSTTVSGD